MAKQAKLAELLQAKLDGLKNMKRVRQNSRHMSARYKCQRRRCEFLAKVIDTLQGMPAGNAGVALLTMELRKDERFQDDIRRWRDEKAATLAQAVKDLEQQDDYLLWAHEHVGTMFEKDSESRCAEAAPVCKKQRCR